MCAFDPPAFDHVLMFTPLSSAAPARRPSPATPFSKHRSGRPHSRRATPREFLGQDPILERPTPGAARHTGRHEARTPSQQDEAVRQPTFDDAGGPTRSDPTSVLDARVKKSSSCCTHCAEFVVDLLFKVILTPLMSHLPFPLNSHLRGLRSTCGPSWGSLLSTSSYSRSS